MHTPILTKNFTATGAVAKRRIVKPGAADSQVAQAAAATDALLGVAADVGAENGGRVDVYVAGQVEVEYGAAVSYGDLLTADAQGKAVPAAPAIGAKVRVVGMAMVSGVAGDIGSVLINPSQITG